MPKILLNLKFWALAVGVVWVIVITLVIMKDPAFAHGVK